MVKKLPLKTADLTEENISKISQLFPNLIVEVEKEGKLIKTIDVEKLKELVGDIATDEDEIYSLGWVGKRASRIKIAESITKTLRPIKEDSVDFDKTENLYIEGDNFEVLKLLKESYLNKVKMIYIDPPYNTGKDFVYRDNFKMSKEDYDEESGAVDEEGNKLFRNTTTNGRFHSDWLSMMYERLTIARDLLKDDGVVFISIDDNEVTNLRKICDEVFGEGNFVAQLPRITTIKGKNDEKRIAKSHDYVLVYSSINAFSKNKDFRSRDRYKLEDNRGKYYVEATLDAVSLPYQKSLDFDIFLNGEKINPITYNGKKISWRWSKDLVKFGIKNDLIVNKKGRLYTKTYLEYEIIKTSGSYQLVKKEVGGTYRSQLLLDYKFSNNEASRALKELKIPFDYSKPVKLISQLMKMIPAEKGDIILDFFSGSATTAHAVMQLNVEDGEDRKFIMVQLPEETDKESGAFKDGYKNICEIGKERIRRAAKKIKEDNKEKDLSKVDFGFKVFRIDSSNMKDVYYNPNAINQTTLGNFKDNIKDDRTPEDLLYQVLIDMAIPISAKVKENKIKGKNVFVVETESGEPWLVACFDNNVDLELVKEIADIKPLKAVFRDSSFKNDSAKVNCEEYLKNKSPNTILGVI